MLHPDVCDGDHTGILAVHSLSKRSNLAGYRCGFVAGDRDVVAELLAVRKNLGLQMPGPQQARDGGGARRRRARRGAARALRRAARRCCAPRFEGAGFRVDHSEASLYLWATRDEPTAGTPSAGWPSWASWSRRGTFYGRAGARHVRVAFTATDERVAATAARRLAD